MGETKNKGWCTVGIEHRTMSIDGYMSSSYLYVITFGKKVKVEERNNNSSF